MKISKSDFSMSSRRKFIHHSGALLGFIYLRDEVGRGRTGLVRILNSDWSDSFFRKFSPNLYSQFAGAMLNTTVALAVLPKLIVELTQSADKKLIPYITAVQDYHDELSAAFLTVFGNRDFAARCFLNHTKKAIQGFCSHPHSWPLYCSLKLKE